MVDARAKELVTAWLSERLAKGCPGEQPRSYRSNVIVLSAFLRYFFGKEYESSQTFLRLAKPPLPREKGERAEFASSFAACKLSPFSLKSCLNCPDVHFLLRIPLAGSQVERIDVLAFQTMSHLGTHSFGKKRVLTTATRHPVWSTSARVPQARQTKFWLKQYICMRLRDWPEMQRSFSKRF